MRAPSFSVLLLMGILCPSTSLASQIPLISNPSPDLSSFLNFSSPAPYITHSLASLLQQWSQTFFPNGHTISSVRIPRHTLLYHGRHDEAFPPPSPEWFAFDIEMAYGIMGNMPDSRMLTYRTTNEVKAVYFDGTSASLMGEGTSSQMVFLYNSSEGVPRRGGWGPPGHGPPPGRGRPGRGDRPPNSTTEEKEPGPPHRWNPLEDEYLRAKGLCNWLKKRGLGGRGWGYEGIVRMNAGFELIWCDFESDSIKLVSSLNVSAPRLGSTDYSDNTPEIELIRHARDGKVKAEEEGPHGPGMVDSREPFRNNANWMWFSAAAKRYSGEPRARVDTCGLFSFYEPAVQGESRARSLQEAESFNLTAHGEWIAPEDVSAREAALEQLLRRKRSHRLSNVTRVDGFYAHDALESRLKNTMKSEVGCSGIDWQLIAQGVMDTYSTNLRNLLEGLRDGPQEDDDSWDNTRAWLHSIRTLTHWLLMPYLEYPPGRPYQQEDLEVLFGRESPVARRAFERCRDQYDTANIKLEKGERVLSEAIKETLSGICRTTISVGMAVELEWLSNFNEEPHEEELVGWDGQALTNHTTEWRYSIEELIAWLGWVDQWTSCEGPCGVGELCYIPMWPVAGFPRRGRGPPHKPDGHIHHLRAAPGWGDNNGYLWEPVCVNASSYPP